MFPGGLSIAEEEERAVVEAARSVVRSKQLSRSVSVTGNPFMRPRVAELERRFAARMQVSHALAVNSGTSALMCALASLGIGPGDEVIVPAYTWFSTATSVLAVGAVPVVGEVDASLTLDPVDLEHRISPYTRAVIAVHMRGAPADMDALGRVCGAHDLRLIEDVAQAVGGSFRGAPLGTLGDLGTYSFEMSKLITAGEGGMVVTGNPALHRVASMYHDSAAAPRLGIRSQDWLAGMNLRMSELQAAVLLAQLERLDALIGRMRAHKRDLESVIRERLETRGARFRADHDVSGDVGLASIFFLEDPAKVPALVRRLQDENVPASRLFHDLAHVPQDIVDLHAFPAWTPLIEKRSWSISGEPWRSHPRAVEYGPDSVLQTVDLLRRAVQIDVSPALERKHIRQMGQAILQAI